MKQRGFLFLRQLLACALSGVLAGTVPGTKAFAAPVGGVVSAGGATIETSGVRTDIHQHTPKAVIDWRGFDIGTGEVTQFYQPSRDSFTLNRVGSAGPSKIDGSLTANGHVMIVNPNGVVFGAGSKVDVGGLTASTADISNKDFMSGKFNFATPGKPDAKIVNQGTITARDAGLVGLVAPQVENSGTINARLGKVQLGSGDSFTLDYYGDGLINLKASDAIIKQVVSNSGAINADGGKIRLTAAQAREHVDSLVDVSGTLKANAVAAQNGEIVLYSQGGATQVSGQVSATSDRGTGGNVDVLGDHVALNKGASIDVSGATGGGNVRIGGDLMGKGTTPTATQTYVAKGATIKADATTRGNGGKVVVWSNGETGFYGHVSAKGGAKSGKGGQVETSGKRHLDFQGIVDATAANGQAGTLLMDPTNIIITNAADTGTLSWTGSQFQDVATTPSNISVNTLQNQLALSNVLITTASALGDVGDITISNPVTWSSGNSLTLFANNDINVNAAITYSGGLNSALTLQANNSILFGGAGAAIAGSTGKLDVTLNADRNGAAGGAIALASGSSIRSNGGNITLGGGAAPGTTATLGTAANKTGIDLDNAQILAGGGNISLRGSGFVSGADAADHAGVAVRNGSLVQTTGTGTVTIDGTGGLGTGNYAGVWLNGGANNIATGSGALTITGSGASQGSEGGAGIWLNDGSITSTSGNIALTGYHVGNRTFTGGVYLRKPTTVSTGGTGTINITGYGPAAVTGNATTPGVWMPGTVTAVDGDITITGDGRNGTGSEAYGIYTGHDTDGGGTIRTTGAGNIIMTGFGGNGGNGDAGISTEYDTIIRTNTGNITMTGTAYGNQNGGYGLYFWVNPIVQSTGGGSITMTATGNGGTSDFGHHGGSSATIGGANTKNVTLNVNRMLDTTYTIRASDDVTIKPRTAGSTVGVGAGAGTLAITDVLLNSITYGGTLWLGGDSAWNQAGNLTITNSAYNYNGNVNFLSGADVRATAGVLTKNGGAASTAMNFLANNAVIFSGSADVTAAAGALNLTFNADRDQAITPGGYIQLQNGSVITSNGGNIVMGGGTNPSTTPSIGTAANQRGLELSGAQLLSGAGNITMNGTGWTNAASTFLYGVWVGNVSTVQTTSGNITMNGTGGAGLNTNIGVNISNGGVNRVSTSTGTINIRGTGGNGTGSFAEGILVGPNAIVESTSAAGAGLISLNGTGSNGTSLNVGMEINGSITSANGGISLTGQGGTGSTNGNHGIYITGGTLQATNGAGITLNGTGGSSGTNNSYGVDITGASSITSNNGNIAITGIGGTAVGTAASGIITQGASTVAVAGTGTLTFTGTTGNATGGSSQAVYFDTPNISVTNNDLIVNGVATGSQLSSYGIYLDTNAGLTSNGTGNITLTGTGSSATNDIKLDTAGVVGGAAATGKVSLIANSLNISTNTILQTAAGGDIIIRPRTAGTTVGVGTAATGTLSMTNGFLSAINQGGTLWLGGDSAWNLAGDMNINSTTNFTKNVTFESASNISVTGGLNKTAGGAASLTMNAGSTISTNSNIISTTGAWNMNFTAGGGFQQTAGTITTNGGTFASTSLAAANLNTINASTVLVRTTDSLSDITTKGAITTTAAGNSLVLATEHNFINTFGAGALNPGAGRYLVYANDPSVTIKNGLTGTDLYGYNYIDNPPSSVTATGNRFLFRYGGGGGAGPLLTGPATTPTTPVPTTPVVVDTPPAPTPAPETPAPLPPVVEVPSAPPALLPSVAEVVIPYVSTSWIPGESSLHLSTELSSVLTNSVLNPPYQTSPVSRTPSRLIGATESVAQWYDLFNTPGIEVIKNDGL